MGEKGGYQLQRTHSLLVIAIVLLAMLRTWTVAPPTSAAEAFKQPPYPLQVVGGGNCVWLAWEMAWLRWGFILPVTGHASQWTSLDGVKLQQGGRVGTLKVADQPLPDSIMIIPPCRQSQHQIIGGYGHLAWVKEVDSQGISVIESSIFPRHPGQKWKGCWYQHSEYDLSSVKQARFLCLADVQPAVDAPPLPVDFAFLNGDAVNTSYDLIWQSCRDMWSYTWLSIRLTGRALMN